MNQLFPKSHDLPAPEAVGPRKAAEAGSIVNANRVPGLDSTRFVCAMWVVFSHFGFIPLPGRLDGNTPALRLLRGMYNNMFCGVAAVIVFFVISGFCIHYPFRNARSIPTVAFLARRYLRIGIPVTVALLVIALYRSSAIAGFYNAILWSLLAELVYYTIYPALFPLIQKFGWRLVTASYFAAYLVICSRPETKNYHNFGPYLTWIVGLPCWLLGCMLAKSFTADEPPLDRKLLWLARAGIWFFACLASTLRFHSPIGYPWTLNVFAIACFFWLRWELRCFQGNPPPKSLERAGAWSYSLYLCHVPVFIVISSSVLTRRSGGFFSETALWLLQIAACLVVSYSFYLLVEGPAHRLARNVGRALKSATLRNSGSC